MLHLATPFRLLCWLLRLLCFVAKPYYLVDFTVLLLLRVFSLCNQKIREVSSLCGLASQGASYFHKRMYYIAAQTFSEVVTQYWYLKAFSLLLAALLH